MIPWALFWIGTVTSGIWANRIRRYDDDYVENGYLRSGKKYSPNMHSYQAGDGYNGYADGDRYVARNLQRAPDYQRDNSDDGRDGRSGAYKYGESNWMGQHYPAKSTYIHPTPTTSSSTPACTTPSCVTVTTSTTISRLVSICQLPTTSFFTGTGGTPPDETPALVRAETGTCTLLPLPTKLIPGCCSCSTTASSYEPCYTTTFVRTILKDKTCTVNVKSVMYKHEEEEYYISLVNMASVCAL